MAPLGAGNYPSWAASAQARLQSKGLWSAVAAPITDAGRAADEKARGMLVLMAGDDHANEMINEQTAVEVWSKLEQKYVLKTMARQIALEEEIGQLRMDEGEPIQKYFDRGLGLERSLKLAGVSLRPGLRQVGQVRDFITMKSKRLKMQDKENSSQYSVI
ncbi:hypothetical protein TSOC_009605 [Tetrabaena socialis]|uniref:DUF4219 domain-containing protein n=1 Tax=Tetrabaena socialis TaxID=47790 RepID=A0A2J7ZVF1_9CHLO|nr:hypothetical protein TSOC_009605 [Tetrabaena socialis]|eukprot:PNH04253.1 hypothetical protein TSOC_009605 [Tetrabaena socialis]